MRADDRARPPWRTAKGRAAKARSGDHSQLPRPTKCAKSSRIGTAASTRTGQSGGVRMVGRSPARHTQDLSSKSDGPIAKTSRRNTDLARKALRNFARANDDDDQAVVLRCLSGTENPLPEFLTSDAALVAKMMADIHHELETLRHQQTAIEFGALRIDHTAWTTSLASPALDVGTLRKA